MVPNSPPYRQRQVRTPSAQAPRAADRAHRILNHPSQGSHEQPSIHRRSWRPLQARRGATRCLERRVRHVDLRLRAGRIRIHACQPADPDGGRPARHRRHDRTRDYDLRRLRRDNQPVHLGAGRRHEPQDPAVGADGGDGPVRRDRRAGAELLQLYARPGADRRRHRRPPRSGWCRRPGCRAPWPS